MRIFSYTSDTTGDKFELRDVLDLNLELMTQVQLIVVQMIEVLMAQVPAVGLVEFGSDVTVDLEFYLSRIDKIFVN